WFWFPLAILIAVGPVNRTLLDGRDPWQDYAYLSCMDGIAWGCMAALVSSRLILPRGLLRAFFLAGSLAAVSVIVFRPAMARLGLTDLGLNVSLLDLGVALVLIASSRGLGDAVLSQRARWLRGVGRTSYEVYLSHMLVILPFMSAFRWLSLPPHVIPA